MSTTAQIGVTGLAVMGRNLARNFARNGYTVALHNRTAAKTHALVEEFGDEGDFVAGRDRRGVRRGAGAPAPAGDHGEGGRADGRGDRGVRAAAGAGRHDHRRRQRPLRRHPAPREGTARAGHPLRRRRHLRRRGGRAARARASCRAARRSPTTSLGPMLEKIAAKAEDGAPCVTHVGPDGAGHFVKMVHNGIEYADMQLIAEAYHLLRDGRRLLPRADRRDLPHLEHRPARLVSDRDHRGGPGAHGRRHRQARSSTSSQDQAEQKGTGRWTVQIALDLGVPVSGIAEAVFARSLSGHAELRAASRELAGPDGAAAGRGRGRGPSPTRWSRRCTRRRSCRTRRASTRSRPAARVRLGHRPRARWPRIWRGGCIIRAAFLDRIRAAYDARPDLPSLLADKTFARGDRRGAGRLAGRAGRRGHRRACPRRASRRRWRTTTRCAPSGCPPRSPRGSGTSSVRTPTGAPTARAPSTRSGAVTAPRPTHRRTGLPRADGPGRPRAARAVVMR